MPRLYIIAGPNGAGKTTASSKLLPLLHCKEFVNADTIAEGLSAFNYNEVAFQAGRLMLERIKVLAASKADFSYETTLASKSFLPFIKACKKGGYEVILIYLYIKSINVAIKRVESRVKKGGHSIPLETIRRRCPRSLQNLINLYLPITDEWYIFDNTFERPQVIAEKGIIYDEQKWKKILHSK